jgi:hypothetical protein
LHNRVADLVGGAELCGQEKEVSQLLGIEG